MIVGWLGVVVAGCLSGSFVVSSKQLRTMPWNGAWLVYCAIAQVIGPLVIASTAGIQLLTRVFYQHPHLVAIEVLFGLLFGLGAYLFGACVQRLGIAVSNAIVSGTVALLGSIAPVVTGMAAH